MKIMIFPIWGLMGAGISKKSVGTNKNNPKRPIVELIREIRKSIAIK